MNLRSALRTMMYESGKSQIDLSHEMGYSSQGAISNIINSRRDIAFSRFFRFAVACGYHIVLVPEDEYFNMPIMLDGKEKLTEFEKSRIAKVVERRQKMKTEDREKRNRDDAHEREMAAVREYQELIGRYGYYDEI